MQWINFEQNDFFNIKKSERELVIFTHYIAHCSKDERTISVFEAKEEKQSSEMKQCDNSISKIYISVITAFKNGSLVDPLVVFCCIT